MICCRKRLCALGFVVFLLLAGVSRGEAPLPLWPEGAPGAKGSGEVDVPTLRVVLPPTGSETGVGVVVAPGGGYAGLAMDHEGDQIAAWLNGHGIAAFILRYRHAPHYQHPVPLQDAQRAIRTVRANAAQWGVDPGRIGMIGFSAGGHLTATAGTQYAPGDAKADDVVERRPSRPDFLILLYPVITMTDPYTHAGSRKNLLGENPAPELIEKMSAEKNVTAETPPTFLMITQDDQAVPVQNALLFYTALCAQKVPAELHVYEHGRHGVGLAPGDPILSTWPGHCIAWLQHRGILGK